MADFDIEQARQRKNKILDRVNLVSKSIRTDVIDYYWDKTPQDQDEASKDIKGIYFYLKSAYDNLGSILSDLEN